MTIAAVVTRGFGSFGSVPDVVRMGFGASAPVPPTPSPSAIPAGGTSKRVRGQKPRYYSQRWGEIDLPQEQESNEVAQEVVSQLEDIEREMDDGSEAFARFMQRIENLQRDISVFVESRQIADIAAQVETRVYLAKAVKEMRDEEEEVNELMELL